VSRLHVNRAARVILAGGVVAYPTEGVYGLGCLPESRRAVEHLLAIKERSWRKGLLLVAAGLYDLEPWVVLPGGARREQILATWPGGVTWVLQARRSVPSWISGGRPTVAVRVTAHPLVRALCERCKGALVSTSANVSGHPAPRRALTVRRTLGPWLDDLLTGELGGATGPTPIRDGASGKILRPG
jgi:L-threonylcarbamoyladenylate synthase